MLEGWHQLLSSHVTGKDGSEVIARDLFSRAISLDLLNARAWSGSSFTWAFLGRVGRRSVRRRVRARLRCSEPRTRPRPSSGIGVGEPCRRARAQIRGPLRHRPRASPKGRSSGAVKPGGVRYQEHPFPQRTSLRSGERCDACCRQLDPLNSWYVDREADLEFCADRPEAALRLYQAELAMNPSDRRAQAGLTRSLALLSRYDEAIFLPGARRRWPPAIRCWQRRSPPRTGRKDTGACSTPKVASASDRSSGGRAGWSRHFC